MPRLLALSFTLDPALLSLEPDAGEQAGGETVIIHGRQFADDDKYSDIKVYFGDVQVDPSDVKLLNETKIRVKAPPNSPGNVDVRVVFPSGVEKTLAGAYGYATTFLVTEDGDYLLTEDGKYLVTES